MNGFIVVILALGLSFWNAKAAGFAWVEAHHEGGFKSTLTWLAAALAAIGFTWALAVIALAVGTGFGLAPNAPNVLLQFYLWVLIPEAVFAFLMVYIDNRGNAYRANFTTSYDGTGVSDYVSSYYYYHAIDDMGGSFENIFDLFGDADEDTVPIIIVVVVIGVASLLGVALTYWIISTTAAGDEPMPTQQITPLPRKARRLSKAGSL